MLTMASSIHTLICISAVIISSFLLTASSDTIIRGAYYPSWDRNTFGPSSINANLFTHIFYAFLVPNNVTFTFQIGLDEARFLKTFTPTLRKMNPSLETLFSIGGGGVDPSLFSRMAANKTSRQAFINSSISVARFYGFHGLDLDWEFPKNPRDMTNLGLLLDEWHEAAKADAGRPALRITAAVYYSANRFLSGNPRAYPVASIKKNLDWVNVMNYDYHGGWEPNVTGAHAALYDPHTNLSTSFGIRSWIQELLGSKVVMGLPLYARTWTLNDSSKADGVGAAAVGVGPGEKDGTMIFNKVVSFNKKYRAKVVFDKETVSMYSVVGNSWIGYDDVESVCLKIGFARALGLRGYFFWSLNMDYKWKISEQAFQLW